jgi:hypothetical protein
MLTDYTQTSHLLFVYVFVPIPSHLSLLALEPVLLVEAHIGLSAVQCYLVAVVLYSDLLEHTDQTHTQMLPAVGTVDCYIFDVPALILVNKLEFQEDLRFLLNA